MSVLVVDKRKRPLVPCCEIRARLLLERGRAVVVRRYRFTIRIKDRAGGETQPVRIKIDPGRKATSPSFATGTNHPATVPALAELMYRGRQIGEALTARRGFRRAAPQRPVFASGRHESSTAAARSGRPGDPIGQRSHSSVA